MYVSSVIFVYSCGNGELGVDRLRPDAVGLACRSQTGGQSKFSLYFSTLLPISNII